MEAQPLRQQKKQKPMPDLMGEHFRPCAKQARLSCILTDPHVQPACNVE